MLVFQAVAELLRRSGQQAVFGLAGSSNVTWLAEGVRTGAFRFVRTRHEETSYAAATAYARVTTGIGVATATVGPGFANTVNPMIAAIRDHVPVVLITGHGKRDVNQRGISEAIGAGYQEASRASEVEAAFWQTMRQARWNGSPQVLSIKESILGDEVELILDPDSQQVPVATPDPDNVAAAVDALAGARYPLVLAGWGAQRAGCHDPLVRLADMIGARVATTLNAHRFFAGHPRDMGVCGESSSAVVLEELIKTDVVLAVGASLDRKTTGGGAVFPAAKIIQCEIDIDRDFKATVPELGLLGDAGESVRAITAEWMRRDQPTRAAWEGTPPTHGDIQASVLGVDVGHDPARGLDIRKVYAAFDCVLPDNRIIVGDAGRAWRTMPALLNARDSSSWLNSRGHNSIGLGMGAAIGAATAAPDRPVVLFCGDGGFAMSAQELDTIRLHDLSVTVVIMDDGQYGSELHYLDAQGLPHDVVRQDLVDTVALARVYGGDGLVLRQESDLAELQPPGAGLRVIRAAIDPDVNWSTFF